MTSKHSANLLDKYNLWSAQSEASYEPWLKVHDVSSKGVSSIVLGRTTGRNHHFLSLIELSAFLLLDWNEDVIDIKEQFALDPIQSNLLADETGIKHPAVRGKLIVMTTDLLIKLRKQSRLIAIQIKPSEQLDDPRVIEKLELERRYWARKKVTFLILTEKDIPKSVVENVQWLQPMLAESLTTSELEHKLQLYRHISTQCLVTMPIRMLSQQIDIAYDLPMGESLKDLRKLVAHRYISVDLAHPFYELTVKDILDGSDTSRGQVYAITR